MPNDKKLHLLCGFAIALVAGIYTSVTYTIFGIGAGVVTGLICGMVAGVAKEVYDYMDYGLFDKYDMLITWLGAVAGAGLVYMIS